MSVQGPGAAPSDESPWGDTTRLVDMAQKEAAAPGTRRAEATDPAASAASAASAGSAASPTGEIADDIASMSYEQARDELVDIVARLENGESGLEESMGLWQRGEALAAHCASWLDRAEARITAEE